MHALVLERFGGPFVAKEVPTPAIAPHEALVRVRNVGVCGTDVKIRANRMGLGVIPLIMGHEIAGEVAEVGAEVRGFAAGDRVVVNFYLTCGRCPFCRAGRDTLCPETRQHGFSIDGGFAEYAINHINTLARVPDTMSDAEATLVVTAGTSMYGLTELGGLVAGESVVVIGPGPIGLLAVAVAKALGASPVILTGTRNSRLAIGKELGADRVINIGDENAIDVVRDLTGGIGADYVLECAGTEATVNQAIHMANRGGKICLAAFPHDPVTTDLAHLVKNNIYVFGIRGEGRSATRRAMALMAEKRFDATKIHTHTFALADLPTALRYARDRVENAIKVVVTNRPASVLTIAAAE